MATRRILPAIDLRTPQERRGLSGSEALAESLSGILQTIGKAEKVRQDRLKLDTISTAMAGGASMQEALKIATEQDQFAPGLKGGLQRVGSAFAPQGGGIEDILKQTIFSNQLKRALSGLTPEEQKKAARVKAGIDPRASATSATRPTEPTIAQKDRDKDIKILTDVNLSGPNKGGPKFNAVQKTEARKRLRLNPELQSIQPGTLDDQFAAEIEGKPREKAGKFDKAFGKEAYDQTLQDLKDAALSEGATEASVEADFNRWWDSKVEAEAGEKFVKFIPRSEFDPKAKKEEKDARRARVFAEVKRRGDKPHGADTQTKLKRLEELRRKAGI